MNAVGAILLAGLLGYWGPWWGMALAAVLVGAWRAQSGGKAFVLGAVGVGSWWLVLPVYTHLASGGILTSRLAELVGLSIPSLVLFATASLGVLLGGLAGVAGYQGKRLVLKPKKRY